MIAHADDYGIWLAAVVGGFTALGWLVRKAWKPLKRLSDILERVDKVIDLADHELRPNSGSSLYDTIGHIRRGQDAQFSILDDVVDRLDLHGTQIDELRGLVLTHLGTQAEANKAMWPAIEAVATATPPHE